MFNLEKNIKNEKTLVAWISGERFPHAIIIEGQAGSGKKTLAKEIAKGILCTGNPVPCGVCPHCVKLEKNIHPDYLTFEGEGGARSFHVSKVRDIREEAYVSPNEGKGKIFLLVNGQDMSVQAQNALLKIIEEPPKGVYFILTCENKNQLLPTIQSRGVILTTDVLTQAEVKDIIKNKAVGYSDKEYQTAAEMSGGSVGVALAYLGDEDQGEIEKSANEFWQLIKSGDETQASALLTKYQRDKEGFSALLQALRNTVLEKVSTGATGALGRLKPLQLSTIIDIIDDVSLSVDMNVNMLMLITLLPAKISEELGF